MCAPGAKHPHVVIPQCEGEAFSAAEAGQLEVCAESGEGAAGGRCQNKPSRHLITSIPIQLRYGETP
jgi:hypothetical protein